MKVPCVFIVFQCSQTLFKPFESSTPEPLIAAPGIFLGGRGASLPVRYGVRDALDERK